MPNCLSRAAQRISPHRLVHWPFLLVLVACTLLTPTHSRAAGGQEFSLPVTKLNPSGLMLKIDSRGIDANGYRPLKLEIWPTNGKPWTFDRELRVVLSATRASQSAAKVSQIIELPEGSALAQATVLVPQNGSWFNLSIETYEGGEKLPDLSYDHFRWPNNNGWQWTEARPATLFIDSRTPLANLRDEAIGAWQSNGVDAAPTFDLPDVRTLLAVFPDFNNARTGPPGIPGGGNNPVATGQKISDTSLLALIGGRSRTAMLPPAELPSRWIELSQFDVAMISLADLRLLAQSQPQELAALRDWLSTGPLLVVYGVGQEFANLEEVERLLELAPLTADAGGGSSFRHWLAADSELNRGGLRTPFDDAVEDASVEAEAATSAETSLAKLPDNKPDSSQQFSRKPGPLPFVFRPAKLGRVVALAQENPFPGSAGDWSWLFNALESHWKWYRRTGMSLSRQNEDYWKLLVPGVGKAPAKTFLFLVSLFALVIGPLNFWLLGRARRLYLVILTVPLGAAVVTLGLFAFALFADGLGTRLRIRSFADLDQQTSRAAVWSRQSYYAALAPSQGLVFPADSAVFPLLPEPDLRSAERSTLLAWDGQQQLRRGFLNSRTAAQFMVCRATTSPVKLAVTEASTTGEPPNVENRLTTRIQYLLLRDSRGQYFAGQGLADRATQTLSAVAPAAATTALAKLAESVRPQQPDGYDPDFDNSNLWIVLGGRRWRMSSYDSAEGDPVMAFSLLESNIAAAIRPTHYPLQSGTYVAITDSSPLIITGLSHGREEASFHVIRGRY